MAETEKQKAQIVISYKYDDLQEHPLMIYSIMGVFM